MSIQIKQVDTYAGLLFLALAIAIYVYSGGFPTGSEQTPGAGFFPRLIAVGIGLLAVVQIAQTNLSSEGDIHELERQTVKRVAIPLALLVLYVATMPLLGFLVGTISFLAVIVRYSGVERLRSVAAFSFGIALPLQYIFGQFLRVPLPEGLVPFANLLPELPLVLGVMA